MAKLKLALVVGILAVSSAPLFGQEAKDKVTKGTDGWYAVEFQVGAGKFKVEFPGEPKLESDPKAADERLYSFTNAKTGRRYFFRAGDGYKGSVLFDDSTGAVEGLFARMQKEDARYKNANSRRGSFNKNVAWEVTLDEGKDKGWTHQYVLIRHGCFVHLGSEKTHTDDEEKRFLYSVVVEKGEVPKLEVSKAEPPAGWKEYAFHKTGVSAWSPVDLKNNFRTSGDFGDYTLVLKDGTKTVFSARLWHVKDVKEFDAIKGTIYAPVPAKAAKVIVGGVEGICTYKDGKPVGTDTKFSYAAFVGNFFVSVHCNNNEVVSPADAEKVAVLIVQQLRAKAEKP